MTFVNRAASAVAAACAALLLAACGGGGGGGGSGGSGGGGSSGGGSSPYVLFASDLGSGSIAALTTLAPTAGSTLSANVVEVVPHAGFSLWYDTARDDLYTLYEDVFSTPTVKVVVFGHAATLKSGAAASRTLVLSDFLAADQLILDTAHDRMWVFGSDTQSQSLVEVFDHASTLTGTPVATRVMAIDGQSFAIDFGRDILYANPFANEVAVYTGASTLAGRVFPTYSIRLVDSRSRLTLDAGRDVLYISGGNNNVVTALHNASTATTGPGTTINLPAGTATQSVVADPAHDRLYIGAVHGAFVLDNASTLATGSTQAAEVQAPNAVVQAFAFAGQ